MYARRKGEHGSAILESFLSMILLGMILFGILQLFQLIVTDMVTEYAAFRGARCAAVGFKDEYAVREALIKAAPVSGAMVAPSSRRISLETEKSILSGFKSGDRYVEYADWLGEDRVHTNYHCPHYGESLIGGCDLCGRGKRHYVSHPEIPDTQIEDVEFELEFVNYPLTIPLHEWLTGRESIDISGKSALPNHSFKFME